MGTEWIRAVHVRQDGVYLNSKSNNDDQPYHIWKCDGLTDVYNKEGQHGLDREMLRMFYEYAEIRGQHPSVERYRPCLRNGNELHQEYIEQLNAEYAKLSPEDITTIWLPEDRQTADAKAYRAFKKNAANEFYERLIDFAAEPRTDKPRKQKAYSDVLFDLYMDDDLER